MTHRHEGTPRVDVDESIDDERWPGGRRSCCSTNPSLPSTPALEPRPGQRWPPRSPNGLPPQSSLHTTRPALSFAEQVAVLRDGPLVQIGAPSEFYTAPADPELARFLGEAVVLPAEEPGTVAQCALSTVSLTAPVHGNVTIILCPEQIRLTPLDPDGGVWLRRDRCSPLGPLY